MTVMFALVPNEPLSGGWPVLEETGKPRFALRGLQPFHDFSVRPYCWNLHDYEGAVSQMAKLRPKFMASTLTRAGKVTPGRKAVLIPARGPRLWARDRSVRA
jgi:hypothetical protein